MKNLDEAKTTVFFFDKLLKNKGNNNIFLIFCNIFYFQRFDIFVLDMCFKPILCSKIAQKGKKLL